MMKRSIVTTDVAVCWTTGDLYTLGGTPSTRTRSELARVRLVRIPQVAVPQAPPYVAERKGAVFCKLVDVPEFVQEAVPAAKRDAGCEPYRSACSVIPDTARATEAPPSDAVERPTRPRPPGARCESSG
jgi:hypothetical protein